MSRRRIINEVVTAIEMRDWLPVVVVVARNVGCFSTLRGRKRCPGKQKKKENENHHYHESCCNSNPLFPQFSLNFLYTENNVYINLAIFWQFLK